MGQNLSTIKQLLAEHGLQPKYKYGQNFLHDQNHIGQIVAAAAPKPGQMVLEIGPGTGALSEALLEAGAQVVAAEIDTDLAPLLEARMAPFGDKFTLVMGDALAGKHAIAPAIINALGDQDFYMVANLPYNAGSPIMMNLAIQHPNCTRMVVMTQKEVADRLVAAPGNKIYGPLGIIAQALFQISKVSTLPPGCFYPPPKVHSAVTLLQRRPAPLCHDIQVFADTVHTLFQKRRKQVGSIIGRDRVPDWLDGNLRPENLSIEQLCQLAADLNG